MNFEEICQRIRGRLIVSCQSREGDPLRDSSIMARIAQAALTGGAVGIRANGPDDVRAIRAVTDALIIGIHKEQQPDGRTLITPTFESAQALVKAGANMVALDVTSRGRSFGALDRLRRIRSDLGVPALADIATVEEGIAASAAGADFILSTMRGYTVETADSTSFEPEFIRALTKAVVCPILAEGRIQTVHEAHLAITAGAIAVVVGTAITRPAEISHQFSKTIEEAWRKKNRTSILGGIDLGGTNSKFGLITSDGRLIFESVTSTPARQGREALLNHVKRMASELVEQAPTSGQRMEALGIATAGWVDLNTGDIAYATDNLPGWTGTRLKHEIEAHLGLPVMVENDANALAVAEKHFGVAKDLGQFLCLTLGTGLGGGCYVNNQLNRGARGLANAIGHIQVDDRGIQCTCGKRGCLETATNAAALLRYAGPSFASVEEVIRAANRGDPQAVAGVEKLAEWLAKGCRILISILDPSTIILAGGLVQNNPLLIDRLAHALADIGPAYRNRPVQVLASKLGYTAGILGAGALTIDQIRSSASNRV